MSASFRTRILEIVVNEARDAALKSMSGFWAPAGAEYARDPEY